MYVRHTSVCRIPVLDTALTPPSDQETRRRSLVPEAKGGSYTDPQFPRRQSLALATAVPPQGDPSSVKASDGVFWAGFQKLLSCAYVLIVYKSQSHVPDTGGGI